MSKSQKNSLSDSKEARASRLKQLRALTLGQDQKKLSRAILERKYGLSASTLRHWEEAYGAGLTETGAKYIIDIYQQEGIKCSMSWLLNGSGPAPFRAEHQISSPSEDITSPLETITIECDYFKKLHPEAMVLDVKDDAMFPYYQIGDIVGGIRHYRKYVFNFIGHDCIVETKKGETLLRRLQKSTMRDYYNLVALNPDTKIERPYIYDAEIIACSPIVRIWRGKKWRF